MKQCIVSVVVVALLISFEGVKTANAQEGLMSTWIDPATGNVLLDASAAGPAGQVVSGWGIFSAGSIFTGDAANIDPGVSFLNTDKDDEVSTGAITLTGTNDLGNIIGEQYRNMSVGFYDDVSGIYFIDGVPGTFTMDTQVIPEPSSMVLAAFGLVSLSLYGWRRRKA